MSLVLQPLAILREHRRAFVVLAVLCPVMFLVGVLVTAVIPELRPSGLGGLQADSGAPGLGTLIADAYRSENVAWAAAVTLGVNLVSASFLQTTLPSLVIPFIGVVITVVRAFSWGILFSPLGRPDSSYLVHYVTLLIEGGAYLIVGFAAWVQARRFLQPQRFGRPNRRAGYLDGLAATAKLYVWVVVLLVIGAVYEAFSVIHLIA
ncbi:hypothetical protein [Actinoplanes friuliensis]|uniref:Stage II sporulation protein M n=1 Tax=Actinoplanes friuliensis DSM 7358 TaxID=1246995 RepID=U5VVC5_9ACTN|nr:hypothetical protein [Actinoplanes friuliensis]AGZ40958.1 hypothetical protein AFR_13360 [Actinoplanes friuliensis DSM 7358]